MNVGNRVSRSKRAISDTLVSASTISSSINGTMDTLNISSDLRVFMHHIYEFEKGVRRMVLSTLANEEIPYAEERLRNRSIPYFIQPTPNTERSNLFFGSKECMEAIRLFVNGRSLNSLTPEEDFILGAMLGYDICRQCERYCQRKSKS